MTENDWRIQGRTEALDFVGQLIEQWKKAADEPEISDYAANAYLACAEDLEIKIEEFANT